MGTAHYDVILDGAPHLVPSSFSFTFRAVFLILFLPQYDSKIYYPAKNKVEYLKKCFDLVKD